MIDWGANVLAPCLAVFGEPVTYTPAAGSPFQVTGVFDNAYKDVSQSDFGTDVISVYPVLGINLADFPAPPAQGDQLTVASNGKTYAVREPRQDSHGGALLILNYLSG
jgi:hypothetical protein